MNQWHLMDFLSINLSNYCNSLALSCVGSITICLVHHGLVYHCIEGLLSVPQVYIVSLYL